MSLSRPIRALTALFAGLAIALIAGFVVFAATVPSPGAASWDRLVAEAGEVPAGRRGIVALTGGAGLRIEHALLLRAQGLGDRVLISGVNPTIEKADLADTGAPDILECCVDLGPYARTTRGNALETRSWVRRHDYELVYLVTSNFHLRRAIAELEAVMPEVRIIGVPVDSRTVPEGAWFGSADAWKILGSEYLKLLVVRFRSLF